ncbi:leucine--tRNA ligase [Candidatus Daviesbacteria bacterium RIFCSPLOWO2_01_FULL_43_38]|uniref:Leucine--tRNA ligase n=3 Tax=Candidatus Daviesiibacteriota TaxID=1752718 RepID=A0A1F5K5S1_9BACT|nr:MAG: Leucine-tRNA ligase [Candidatus Daviesbacteria bacterium GW2011_GWA1_42_6]KKS70715.1 MAG: Leucine-tRNA ligase [Candidatus Daviesbacteria bacterium GW2011_GWA2_42_7]OGE19214.1 MAG: leucine--tRNA ligase [Candidatus Daviesbacteria bacterium RIFCSPHIGHO2_01_FULL_43_17]OGE36277.1 MAG: leucine--tRNA ligase [Candidatus Daviesbacteria bacterium RIFCSPHIGHO2_12_FULL_43_11]OGE63329.1 MAG: leucine--tRNA ligase [Candidatus Daviesbacteria bacterium RIFCSPLOWO2_01_FULL_43_38]OGE70479.1 MAG: leucine-
MAKRYFPNEVEGKWQKRWKEDKLFSPDLDKSEKPFYSLMMFPYPSAEGMHVGNMYAFTGSDIYSRFKRLQGLDVFEPIGLDGFGIHGENYALKINEHPMEVSRRTEKHFYEQFMTVGNAYDWNRTLNTYEPEYYKWTQWAFLQLYKKGIAYRKKAEVNWCPSCKTVLADEQVITGACERCSSQVEKKDLEQWFFKITDYAERLLKNLEWIDWSEKIKVAQRNWIGKSEGTLIAFDSLDVFTTRADTIFGATFVAVSPEHPLLSKLVTDEQKGDVSAYIEAAGKKSELERKENKEKTGVFTGTNVKNPFTGESIPVWVADYVLMGYGTGVIMAVPAHDERDFEFAKKFDLPIKTVIENTSPVIANGVKQSQNNKEGIASSPSTTLRISRNDKTNVYTGEGILVNSGEFDGLSSTEAREKISDYIEKHNLGKRQVHFHLRDWLISRQRYWGPPIPIIYCDKCGAVPVPESDLPVKLPFIENFRPTGTGISPLASEPDFVNVKCPKCAGPAKRETDVSDNFLDSSLYFFRYLTTDLNDRFFDEKRAKNWLPVDMYIGGAEHSVLHLLYSRFITMVFRDLGFIDFEEPFKKFRAHGLIIAEGAKMSKSKGNVINPDNLIKEWGADTLRMYLMFMGPFTEGGDFRAASISGVYRFLSRVWELAQNEHADEATEGELKILNKVIKKVGEDMENLRFNTAIASLMEFLNFLSKQGRVSRGTIKAFLVMLTPFAPHTTEELWEMMGENRSIHLQTWPKYEEKYLEEEEVTIAVQVNGKVRDQLVIHKDMASDGKVIEKIALGSPKVQKFLDGKEIKKAVYVPVKIINFVTE